MKRIERVKAALKSQEVDKVPLSAWMHLSEFDQDPISLAKASIAYNEKYDFDFIKMMPFGAYSVQDYGAEITVYCDKYKEPIIAEPGIQEIADYTRLEVLPAYYGTYGKTLQFARELAKRVDKDTPFVQTIFSPFSTLKKLAGNRLLEDIKTNPKEVHQALEVITETTKNFIKANIELGVHGFFLATQNATSEVLSMEEFEVFGVPYDKKIIETYKDKTYFNVIHIHGSGEIYFEKIANEYDVNCINWHDRTTAPSLKEARAITDKCLLGGIKEAPYFEGKVLRYASFLADHSADDIIKHVKEAVDQVDGRGLMVGPGCVVDPKTSEESILALRKAVDQLGAY